MSDKDNVTPITPGIQGYKRVEGSYEGASNAVYRVLKENGFDENVKGKGWIELIILARFTDEGAMFHTVQASRVIAEPAPTKLEAPAFTILRMMALANSLSPDAYIQVATIGEMDTLDKELRSITPEQAEALVDGDEDEQLGVVEILKCQASYDALKAIFQRGAK